MTFICAVACVYKCIYEKEEVLTPSLATLALEVDTA